MYVYVSVKLSSLEYGTVSVQEKGSWGIQRNSFLGDLESIKLMYWENANYEYYVYAVEGGKKNLKYFTEELLWMSISVIKTDES